MKMLPTSISQVLLVEMTDCLNLMIISLILLGSVAGEIYGNLEAPNRYAPFPIVSGLKELNLGYSLAYKLYMNRILLWHTYIS
jgi:hypothetical protein